MTVTRREFLAISGVVGAGLALSSLGLDMGPVKAYAADLKKIDKMKTAKQSTTICAYCAVGCGLICSTDTKDKKIINIEGDPDHPINEGCLVRQGRGSVPDHGQQSQSPYRRSCTGPPRVTNGRKSPGTGHSRR